MLPLEEIKKYYHNASEDEVKEIKDVVYLLACSVMQECYGLKWMGSFEESDPDEK